MARRILVIDDEPEFIDLMGHVLAGYRVDGRHSVQDAQRFLQRNRVDLISLDIRLPGQLGWDLLARYGNDAKAAPIIVITAQASSKVRQQADQMGAVAIFFKPILPSEVRRFVQRLIGKP